MPIVVSLVILAATVFALIDIIRRDDGEVKHLPKLAWVLLVVLVPIIGILLWFLLGREYESRPAPHPRGYHDPVARVEPVPVRETRSTETRSTEQQLADLEREIEEERLRAELARRRREREAGAGD